MYQQHGDDTASAFRVQEKRYQLHWEPQFRRRGGRLRGTNKLVAKPTDLSDVIDASAPDQLQGLLAKGEVAQHWLPEQQLTAYSYARHPGLLHIPGALLPAQQLALAADALQHYPQPPATSNHTLAYGPLPCLWQAAQQQLRLTFDKQPLPLGQGSKTFGAGQTEAADPATAAEREGWEAQAGQAAVCQPQQPEQQQKQQQLLPPAERSFASCWSPHGCGPAALQLLGKLRWVSLGPQFNWTTRVYEASRPHTPLPAELQRLALACAAAAQQVLAASQLQVQQPLALHMHAESLESCAVKACCVPGNSCSSFQQAQAAAGSEGQEQAAAGSEGQEPQQQGATTAQTEPQQQGATTAQTDAPIYAGHGPDSSSPPAIPIGQQLRQSSIHDSDAGDNQQASQRTADSTSSSTCGAAAGAPGSSQPLAPGQQASAPFRPDAALVNFYHEGDTLGGHRDDVERDMAQPIVSLSLGCSAVFLIGGDSKEERPSALLLCSGDVLVLSGAARSCYHGVPRILSDQGLPAPLAQTAANASQEQKQVLEYLSKMRINISIRAVG